MHGPSYDEYLASSEWRALRARYKRERGWACFVCGATEHLDLHHISYGRLGDESLDDLVPLCRTHHDRVHGLIKKQGRIRSVAHLIASGQWKPRLTVLPPEPARRRRKGALSRKLPQPSRPKNTTLERKVTSSNDGLRARFLLTKLIRQERDADSAATPDVWKKRALARMKR